MACGNCGWEPKQHGQRVDFADGELGLVIGGKAQRRQMSRDEQLTLIANSAALPADET